MRILHINTYNSGGAAKAAIRLHEGLLKLDVDSHFLFLESKHPEPTQNFSIYPNKSNSGFGQLIREKIYKLKHPEKKVFDGIKRNHRSSFEWISFPFSGFDLATLANQYDVVNLHWVADFLNYPTFFKQIQIPVVWTLHDMNPFSGIVHYSIDLANNYELLNGLETWALNRKKKAVSSIATSLNVVSPSLWMQKEAQNSAILGRFNHHHIPYGIDLNVFKPVDKTEAKRKTGLDENKKTLLFLADNLKVIRKGADFFLELVNDPAFSDVQFITVGENHIAKPNVTNFGRIDDTHQLALVYSAADIFVQTARMDNLPNTLFESMACGTPVVGFAIGGLVDLIVPGRNGALIEPFSVEQLKSKLLGVLSEPHTLLAYSINAREFIQQFTLERQARSYHQLYSNILG